MRFIRLVDLSNRELVRFHETEMQYLLRAEHNAAHMCWREIVRRSGPLS